MADKSVSEYTEAEVQKHASETDLWMIIDNGVYDVTKFMDEHPGGSDILLEHAGTNATLAFEEVGHSADARALLEKYKVGSVKGGSQKFCFRVKQEESATARVKSTTSAKTSSVRICVPDAKDSLRSNPDTHPASPTGTKSIANAPSRTKSVVSTPSRTRCLSCCRAPSVCEPSRSKSALDQSGTKPVTSHRSPSQITKQALSAKPHVDAAKAKPIAAVKPTSYTETSRRKISVSPKTSYLTEPSRTKSAANDVSRRHKECFTEPPVPWRTKSSIIQGQPTPPPRSRPVTPPSCEACSHLGYSKKDFDAAQKLKELKDLQAGKNIRKKSPLKLKDPPKSPPNEDPLKSPKEASKIPSKEAPKSPPKSPANGGPNIPPKSPPKGPPKSPPDTKQS